VTAALAQRVEWHRDAIGAGGGRLVFAEAAWRAGAEHAPGPPGPDRLDPVVLLHGFTGSHESWNPLLDVWSPAARVIALDLPGHGRSRCSDAAAHTMAGAAAALESLLDELGIAACNLLGYSMGGRLALYFALEHRDRVRRLMLESASPGLATEQQRADRRLGDEALACYALDSGIEAFVDRWEHTPVLADEAELDDEVRAELRVRRLSCSAAGLAASLRGMGTGAQPWLGERLEEIEVPVLLVAGARDTKFSAIAQSMAARLGAAELAQVEGAGHNVHVARPQQLAHVLDTFISSTAAAVAGERAASDAPGSRRIGIRIQE